MSNRRVVITGLGFISPLGLTVQQNWDALMKGKRGIGTITSFPCTSFPIRIAGEVKNFNPHQYHIKTKSLKLMNKTIQYAVATAYQACLDANIEKPNWPCSEIGMSLGVDGIQYTVEESLLSGYEAAGEDFSGYMSMSDNTNPVAIKTKDPNAAINPLWPLTVLPNMSLCHIAILQQFNGPNLVFSSIDAAGSQAIGESFQSIRQGECDMYLAGGSYALNTTHLVSFAALNLLSRNNSYPLDACRPFDRARDGCVLGEGSAMMVLEEVAHAQKRGASIYAEIVGYGSFFNGDTIFSDVGSDPPDAKGMQSCMANALTDANISVDAIDYISATGQATALGDRIEARAMENTFGRECANIPVGAYKAAMGHLLPASGAAEAAITALCIREGCIPPTINYSAKDSACALNVVSQGPLKKDIHYAIANTFGFTGEHTTLVFKKYN